MPLLSTTVASAAPLPLALVALGTLDPSDAGGRGARLGVAGLALGLSLLGGEPVVTAIGAAGAAALALVRAGLDARAGRWPPPAAPWPLSRGGAPRGGDRRRPAPSDGGRARALRAGLAMRPEDGALFWSVRPSRLLTLLEPRLTGDPAAEDDRDYWGAPTFDAGNPYFHDLALGLVPLLLAAAASGDARGRAALGLAALAALLSFGRFVAPVGALLGALPVLRYPEKWWILATFGLCGAAAIGIDRLRDDDGRRGGSPGAAAVLAALLAVPALLALVAPEALASLLRGACAWQAPASRRNGPPRCSGRSSSRASAPHSSSRSCRAS